MTGLTPERFETLAQAYGGQVADWPTETRDAAALLMAADPAWAQAVLAREGELDGALAAWSRPQVAHALRERVIAAAPPPRARGGLRAWLWRAGLAAGLAAAAAAGLVIGVGLSPDPPGVEAVAVVMSSFDAPDAIGDV